MNADLWFRGRKVEVASSRQLVKISALEVPHATKPNDSIRGGFAGNPEGRPENSRTRRLSLPVLRTGRPRQFRKRSRHARGFCCSARSQREERACQSGSL